MSKDTIYIDVEDDITAIIGKVKGAKSKIVALVPPKRIGVLQSAVNLRLLARAAKQNDKHLVLISGNSALTALAASAGIPAARTLQSKPELAQIPVKADDEVEDIIDGADLPIGDHAGMDSDGEDAQAAPAIDSAIRANSAEAAAIVPPAPRPQAKSRKSTIAVPNFDTFRKKLVAGIVGLALLMGFLVWAIWFAPHAKIIITARTIESSANPKVTLATSATTDVKTGFLRSVQQEIKKEATLEFAATGKKDVGEKATGTIKLTRSSPGAVDVAAGTKITTDGELVFVVNAATTVPGATLDFSCPGYLCPGTKTVSVTALEPGAKYNGVSGAATGIAGVSISFTAATSGGTDKTVAVVTKEDLEDAINQLANQDISATKKQLTDKFGDGVIVIDASFATKKDGVASSPAVDEEAPNGKAKLTGAVSYTMIGVTEAEVGRFLDVYFADKVKDNKNQRVYNNGASKTTFVDVVAIENGFTATMTATATFGPKIDDAAVKSEARGKRYGDVQSAIEGISGVESVDVKFSPFWVRTVPNDEKRITIEFNLDESKQ